MHDANPKKRNKPTPSKNLALHRWLPCVPAWLTYRPLGVSHEGERDEVLRPQRLPRHGALRTLVRLLVVGHVFVCLWVLRTYVWNDSPSRSGRSPVPIKPTHLAHHLPWRRPYFWSPAGTRAAKRRCASAAPVARPGPSGPLLTAPVR